MNKLNFLAAASFALLATACSNDIDVPNPSQSGAETEVMLTLQLPQEIQTYTFGDGKSAPRLQYAVYQHTTDGSVSAPVITGTNVTAFKDGSLSTTQKFKVITGIKYDFVFFADNADGEFEFDSATATIIDKDADDGTIDGNKETRDAFFGVLTLEVTGPFSASVELRRPFAQLNLGTDDLDEQIVAATFGTGLTNLKTSVQTETYKTLNLLTGEASDKVSVTFGSTGIPDNTVENFPVENYDYLSMNYLLMPKDLIRQNCVFTIFNGDTEVRNFTVPNVPVQRNYRTNVYGTLLTTDGEVKIDIKPEFDQPDINPDIPEVDVVADGVLKTETTYYITNANGFQWLADQTTGNTDQESNAKIKALLAGKTIELGADLDMNNTAVKPIRLWCPENPVTFDGMGHTIKNIKFVGSKTSLISITTGTVKNLNIDGMDGSSITSRFCGVAANSYGNFENVHVKNVNIDSNEGRVGAIVGIHNGGNLINCSVENAVIKGTWSVGGMAGAINETKGRNYQNCVVKNVKVVNKGLFGGVYNEMTGVMVGNINLGEMVFTNCQIIDCDTELPIYHSFNDYTWNGNLIKADIDENTGKPLN